MTAQELADEFLVNYAERRLRESTIRGYRTNLEKHILPLIGAMDITMITARTLDMINDAMRHLSNKTKLYVHATLRKVINYAIRRDYLAKNPYRQFDLPKVPSYKYRVLHEDEVKRLLECAKDTELEIPIVMAVHYGLRRGECLGIRPAEDIDFTNNILHIQRTRSVEHRQEIITSCKTEKSNRYILLRPEDAEMLKKQKGKYACSLSPPTLNSRFKKFLKAYEFENIRFHDLRHSFATLMLTKKINPKIVQTVLGHSRIDTTLDIYSHADVSMQRDCLNIWD